jgi:sialic acid synthase SpsE
MKDDMIASDEKHEELIESLKEKGIPFICVVCKNKSFTLINGYVNNMLHVKSGESLVSKGSGAISIVLSCNKCGYMRHHSPKLLKGFFTWGNEN